MSHRIRMLGSNMWRRPPRDRWLTAWCAMFLAVMRNSRAKIWKLGWSPSNASRANPKARQPLPFVAEDILQSVDDVRSEEKGRLFADRASTGLIIVAIDHRRLIDIARRAFPFVSIHELKNWGTAANAKSPATSSSPRMPSALQTAAAKMLEQSHAEQVEPTAIAGYVGEPAKTNTFPGPDRAKFAGGSLRAKRSQLIIK